MLNIGDIIFQVVMFIIIVALIGSVIFFIHSLFFSKRQDNEIEKKLDRIIKLLEKQQKD
jgi:F0F1-type ATP synthase membrane subunit b/b'